MHRKNELLLELEHLDYELETKNMELEGLYRKHHTMKKSIIYYIVPYVLILLFLRFIVNNLQGGGIGYAFSVVLSPIYLVIIFICSIFLIKKIWIVYCNGKSARARKIAKKYHQHSISEDIERCMVSITAIEKRMNELNDELLIIENSQNL